MSGFGEALADPLQWAGHRGERGDGLPTQIAQLG